VFEYLKYGFFDQHQYIIKQMKTQRNIKVKERILKWIRACFNCKLKKTKTNSDILNSFPAGQITPTLQISNMQHLKA